MGAMVSTEGGRATAAVDIARVALDIPQSQPFDFGVPTGLALEIGHVVRVPFGTRQLFGVVVARARTSDVPTEKLREIDAVVDAIAPLDAELMSLIAFCAGYYQAAVGQVAALAIPPVPRQSPTARERWQAPAFVRITAAGQAAMATVPTRATALRAALAALAASPVLATAPVGTEPPIAKAPLSRAQLADLISRGWAEPVPPQTAAAGGAFAAPRPTLRAAQAEAVAAVTARLGDYAAFLLEGITGSGKTEVYLHAIEATLRQGKQALILVPEINLTPALIEKVRTRFPQHVVVQAHSAMASGARLTGWRAAAAGEADIVVGTRLAVFTPLPRAGIIIVDEEHDASFKQQDGVRYSARDLAVYRARSLSCPVVLGSATPAIESLDNVARGRFEHLVLPERAVDSSALPRVRLVDLNADKAQDGLSSALVRAMRETLARGEQVLVFINRRGFAPALVCTACGWIPDCRHCSVHQVFHRAQNRLKCHHCGTIARVPQKCESCGSTALIAAGQGTERIEDALRAAFPTHRIERVDRDSTRKRGSAERIFRDAAKGELDILVGTQMLAKGHDFPRVTLVGVVNADGAVFSADFRAAERMAQQLMQVAGRAGRASLPGEVIIQTRYPEHPVYQAVAAQRYQQFVEAALVERRMMRLPPYTFLALLRAEARDAARLEGFLERAGAEARDIVKRQAADHATTRVWDAVPSSLSRKAGFHRRQLLVQAAHRRELQHLLTPWSEALRATDARGIRWSIDVDPIDV
jgi:primosomal protein N' (replication factor Y)